MKMNVGWLFCLILNSERQEAFKILTNLGIWQEVRTTQGGMPAWLLKQSFKENLFSGIFEPNQTNEELQTIDPKMIEKLDLYATERWEVKFRFIFSHPLNLKISLY